MRYKTFSSSNGNGFENKFKVLTNNEMIGLRGGDDIPLPPPSGDDYPIDLLDEGDAGVSCCLSVQRVPVVGTVTVQVGIKKDLRKY